MRNKRHSNPTANTNCSFMHKYTNIPKRKGRKRQTLIMNAINKEAEDEWLVEVLV
jgi:hypothetical protein